MMIRAMRPNLISLQSRYNVDSRTELIPLAKNCKQVVGSDNPC